MIGKLVHLTDHKISKVLPTFLLGMFFTTTKPIRVTKFSYFESNLKYGCQVSQPEFRPNFSFVFDTRCLSTWIITNPRSCNNCLDSSVCDANAIGHKIENSGELQNRGRDITTIVEPTNDEELIKGITGSTWNYPPLPYFYGRGIILTSPHSYPVQISDVDHRSSVELIPLVVSDASPRIIDAGTASTPSSTLAASSVPPPANVSNK